MSQPKLLTLRGMPLVHSTWQHVKAFVQHPPRLQTAAFCVVAGVAEALLYGNPPSLMLTACTVVRNLVVAGGMDTLFSSLRYGLNNPEVQKGSPCLFSKGAELAVDPAPQETGSEVDFAVKLFASSQSAKQGSGGYIALFAINCLAGPSLYNLSPIQTAFMTLPALAPIVLDNRYYRRFWDNIFAGKYRVIATPVRNEPRGDAAATSACSPF